MGSAFHQLCPRYSGTLTPTAPTAIRLWDTFTFYSFISMTYMQGRIALPTFCEAKRQRLGTNTIPQPVLERERSTHTQIDKRSRITRPGRVTQSLGHLTRKSGVLGSIPGLATYFRFSFRFFKTGSCQLLAKVCARSTG